MHDSRSERTLRRSKGESHYGSPPERRKVRSLLVADVLFYFFSSIACHTV
jgi:hypothetical protein